MDLDLGQTLLLICLCVYVIPTLLTILLIVMALRAGSRWVNSTTQVDVARLHQNLLERQAKRPDIPLEKHIHAIIHQQSVRCGVIGAVTGLGGVFTLPIALPLDMLLSMRIQSALVELVARGYQHGPIDPNERRVIDYLITTGSEKVTSMSLNYIMRLVVQLLGRSLSKLVPVIGALVSFLLNYAITQGIGRVAIRRYQRAV